MGLLVNVDHLATLRNARGENYPDPVAAARVCEEAGAAGIVFHLRKDRRHILEADIYKLKKSVKGILNFEMAATKEMIETGIKVNPHLITLVPEIREELTTECGLSMDTVFEDFKSRVFPKIRETDIEICLFVDPNPEDINMAAELGSDAVELHTGSYANTRTEEARIQELQRLKEASVQATKLGMKVNAGHGLSLTNIEALVQYIPNQHDISIGHALISSAIFMGLENTVKAFLKIIEKYN